MDPGVPGQVRLDKWLWAARFYKTRTLAAQAISAGHVELNGRRIKPSKTVAVGDTVAIEKDQIAYTVIVCGIGLRRGPAREAARMYEETSESVTRRERVVAERRASRALESVVPLRGTGRPSKRDRRRMERVRRSNFF